ncbi:MAG: hypothetical protein H6649_04190 [Caldilineae bacterium]|nr:hypothetical protein [Anaerolineae bacterium]MCB0205759.1 hypothetical protein [Anaerolineae bacterium]MCB0252603.1 hypothetical protein [Anaerolineae bacterium]MCB9153239.1 hypothetical protein [Caldilineae bacterium]
MDHVRWSTLCLALGLAGLIALGAPQPAAASADQSRHLQENSEAGQQPESPFVAVPGVFSLRLGQGFNSRDGALNLPGAQIDLPALNATATVEGFTFGLRDQSYGWDTITLQQAKPVENDTLTISDMQASIQGPAANFTTDLETRIDVHPSEDVQAGATLWLSYDGATGQPSLAVADGSAQMVVGPATVAVDGINAGDGAFSVDAAQVVFPDAGMGARIDGYTVADGASNWQSLTWFGQEFKLGDVATFSDNLVVVPGPSTPDAATVGAATRFEINAGDAANASGQLVFVIDPDTGQPTLALLDGSAVLGVPGWNVAVNGLNTGTQGTVVNSVVFTAQPLGVQAQISGVAVDENNGVSFDQARFLYQPEQTAEQRVAGFELVVDSTDAGYIVSTTTLVPTAQAK